MPAGNAAIAAVLDEMADLLEVESAPELRIRACRLAARMLRELARDVGSMLDQGEDLDALPGIDADLASTIREVSLTGTCDLLDRLRQSAPPMVRELLRIPGLGPRRARALHQATQQGRVRGVHGVGSLTEACILPATRPGLAVPPRHTLPAALGAARAILSRLVAVPGVEQAAIAGSLRRMCETVGDVDLVVAARDKALATGCLATAPGVRQVLVHGARRASVMLDSGLQVDLRAVPPPAFGAAWLHFTGSRAHTFALRRLARATGLKLDEHGLYRGAQRVACATEDEIYRALGLAYIEPELREGRGEIEAARHHRLPRLVELRDLRGDLHVHTRLGHGHASIEAMHLAAARRGLEYVAISDRTQGPAARAGLDADGLARQVDRIDALNAARPGTTLLKSVEVDILEDGRLGLPDAILARLDLVVAAIHDGFDLSPARQTERLLRAMDHPSFAILAHPTGRLLGARAPCHIDLPRVIRKARERGCFLELNAHPLRLDLADTACRQARDEGVLLSIASDARLPGDFDHLAYGVGQARRGWLGPGDVLNTRSLDQLRPLLDTAMGRRTAPPRTPVAAA